MNLHTHQKAWMCWSVALAVSASASAQTTRPTVTTRPAAVKSAAAATGDSNVGVVKGTNVYVRSGFSTNYYPVTKLNQGDTVEIAGEEFGWLKIDPPAGTYSLVDKTYVDRVADNKGTINGLTWAFAGSNIDNGRYAKQVKLNKGDSIQIIGETQDGAFVKIEPPAGAHLWVKADLIDRTGGTIASAAGAKSGLGKNPSLEPVKPGDLKLTEDTVSELNAVAGGAPAPKTSAKKQPGKAAPVNVSDDKYQAQVDAIEKEIVAESAKPLGDRSFDGIIAKLQPIADQTEDEIWQAYAKTRIEQLHGHSELAKAVQDIRVLNEDAITKANQIAKSRESIRSRPVTPLDDIVLRGEIRVSGIYDGAGNRPKRWRIVQPDNGRTIAYVEVSEGSSVDPVQYYGKYVGIRATGYQILKDTIPPVPVYTIKEIVIQDAAAAGGASRTGLEASPEVPLIVANPSTHPAAEDAPSAQPNDSAGEKSESAKPADSSKAEDKN